VTGQAAVDVGAYCREIEAYLCRRNGGHLIRIAGPAFDLVRGWAAQGIPLRIVCRGIDRYVQRRADRLQHAAPFRPARIEFCEADVLDAFRSWKRAVGALGASAAEVEPGDPCQAAEAGARPEGRARSLPAHLRRAQVRLTSLRAGQRWPEALAQAIDALIGRLDGMQQAAGAARGPARQALVAELGQADAMLIDVAWDAQDDRARSALRDEAADDLAAFRGRLPAAAWAAHVDAAARGLLRERLGLPSLVLE
jgi:hypothetical protein